MATTSRSARASAAVIALVAAGSLAMQIWISWTQTGSLGAALVVVSQYFTILTNFGVMLAMLAVAMRHRVAPRVLTALGVAIAGVGIVYHLLLAHLWKPDGWQFVADQGLHTYVPVLTVLWWLVFSHKTAPCRRDGVTSIAWPLAYCVYALGRAHFSHFYPYPFIDVATLGWPAVARNIAGLAVGFEVLGFVLVWVGWKLGRR